MVARRARARGARASGASAGAPFQLKGHPCYASPPTPGPSDSRAASIELVKAGTCQVQHGGRKGMLSHPADAGTR